MAAMIDSMRKKGAKAGMKCLLEICAAPEQRPADRIAAAKVLLDYGIKNEDEPASPIRVILEGVPEEYLT